MTELAIDMNSLGDTFTEKRTYIIRLNDGREMSFDTPQEAQQMWRFYYEPRGPMKFLENALAADIQEDES